MFQSLKDRINALPEEAREARRAFYTDEEWENSWELQAFPFQLPPTSDWLSWTVVGGRRVGKSEAGYRWAWQKFLGGGKVLCVIYHDVKPYGQRAYQDATEGPNRRREFMAKATHSPTTSLEIVDTESTGIIKFISERDALQRGVSWDFEYMWADEISDASVLMQFHPLIRQYVFTQPVKLDPQTVVSRAGDRRVF